jgi:hypothetical protein
MSSIAVTIPLKIKSSLKDLIVRFHKHDNYAKMNTILDYGEMCVEYNSRRNLTATQCVNKIVNSGEVEDYRIKLTNADAEINDLKKELKENKHCNDLAVIDAQNKLQTAVEQIKLEELQKYYDLQTVNKKLHSEKKSMHDEITHTIKTELSIKHESELNTLQKKHTSVLDNNMELTAVINNLKLEKSCLRHNITQEITSCKNEEIINIKQEMNKEREYYRSEIKNANIRYDSITDRLTNDKVEQLQACITGLEKDKEHLSGEVEKNISKIQELEALYTSNSSVKGHNFEIQVYEGLCSVIDKNYNNIWKVTHVGSKIGHKGDIILEHNITKKCIMIDTKNHKTVHLKDKDKFIDDMKNVNNKFDAGFMVANNNISGKRPYEEEYIMGKTVSYISNYQLGMEQWLMTVIERVHDDLIKINKDVLDKELIKQRLKEDYSSIKTQINLCDKQQKYFNRRQEEIVNDYKRLFNGDIDLDGVNYAAISEQNYAKQIKEFLDNCVITEKGAILKHGDIWNKITLIMPQLTSKKFTITFNDWKKKKWNDTSKFDKKTAIIGYKLIES